MNKKVLLLSQYFIPDINAASFRIYDLYTALIKEKYDVTVVTAYPQKSVVEDIKQSRNIHRIKIEKVQKKSFLNYLRNYFGFMFKSIYHVLFKLRKEKYDYIIVTSPPLFVALGGYIISIFKRSKMILDIRDIWPDSAVAAGMLKKGGFLYYVSKKIERFLYNKSFAISCVSKPMKEYILKESNNDNIHVLYNGITPSLVDKDKDLQFKFRKEKGKISVGYAGNIGIAQNLDIVLSAARILPADKFEFIIIGDGIERKRLELEAIEKKINNIVFTGPLTKKDAMKKLEEMDVLFFSLIESSTFNKTIPSKLFDYMLSNKPIITSISGEGRKILKSTGSALFFNPNSPESLAGILNEYNSNRHIYDSASKHNRLFVINNYNREKIFRDFYKKIN